MIWALLYPLDQQKQSATFFTFLEWISEWSQKQKPYIHRQNTTRLAHMIRTDETKFEPSHIMELLYECGLRSLEKDLQTCLSPSHHDHSLEQLLCLVECSSFLYSSCLGLSTSLVSSLIDSIMSHSDQNVVNHVEKRVEMNRFDPSTLKVLYSLRGFEPKMWSVWRWNCGGKERNARGILCQVEEEVDSNGETQVSYKTSFLSIYKP